MCAVSYANEPMYILLSISEPPFSANTPLANEQYARKERRGDRSEREEEGVGGQVVA